MDLGHERDQREQQEIGREDPAGVVDHGGDLAVGVDHEPQVAPRRPHQLGDALDARVRVGA